MPEEDKEKKSTEEINKENDELQKQQDEQLQKLIEEIKSGNKDLTEEDMQKLQELINQSMNTKKPSRFRRFLSYIARIGFKIVYLFVISLVIMGFFFQAIYQDNKWYIFLYIGIISFIISIFDHFYFNKLLYMLKYPFALYFVFILGLAILTIVMNDHVLQVLNDSYMWIFFYMVLEIAYALISVCLFRRRVKL